MEGLLSILKSPVGQGLLAGAASYAAGARRGAPVNSVGRGLLGGLVGYNTAATREEEAAERAKMGQFRDAQIAAYSAEAAQKKAALERQAAQQAALPGLFRQPGMTGGQAVPQTLGGLEMFSQPLNAAPMQATPGGFDVQGAIAAGFSPEQIKAYAELPDVGRPKATRQMEVDDGKGGKRIALVDDFGREVAGFSGYVAPVQVSQGDRVTFARPQAGVSLPVGMSPEGRDASARGWASVGIQRDQANSSKAPAGYRYKPDGSMEIIPGGPADLKASAEGQKKVGEAKDVLGLLDQVDSLLPKATGSYLGAGVDEAFRAFGGSTEGAKATAQLKTLQGALISKMPKMSGPQSDKDVQLYREMAGQVADPTLPVDVRQAASSEIRRLNEKYAGMPEGSSKAPSVVKTGMYGGRKVEQLSDGTMRYAN